MHLLDPARCTRPLFAMPEGDDLELLSVLPTVSDAGRERLLPLLARALELAAERGGRQYPAGWLPPGAGARRRHYGAAWDCLVRLQRRYDPDGILAPWRE